MRVQLGIGTFVTPARAQVDVVLAPLTVDAAQLQAQSAFAEQGWVVRESFVDAASADDADARASLEIGERELTRIRTRMTLSADPWILSSYWLSETLAAGLPDVLPDAGEVLAAVQLRIGHPLRYAWRSFAACAATADDAQHLDVPVGSPLLLREGLNRDDDGPVCFVQRCLRCSA